jgi:hypothetical protein
MVVSVADVNKRSYTNVDIVKQIKQRASWFPCNY